MRYHLFRKRNHLMHILKGGDCLNVNLFKAKIVEHGLNLGEFAEALGVHRTTLYRYFEAPETIPLGFIWASRKKLALTETELANIFFAN